MKINVYCDKSITTKYQLLCEKYILDDSDYPLNISYDARHELTSIYENSKLKSLNKIKELNNLKLVKIFDNCIRDVVTTIEDSLMRWKRTKEFKDFFQTDQKTCQIQIIYSKDKSNN